MWARSAKFPLIDVALLRLPAVNRVAIVQLLSGFGTFATFVAVPVMIQAPTASGGLGLDASASGYALAPFGICKSEEHTSELQSLMRISYAVFCLKKKKTN